MPPVRPLPHPSPPLPPPPPPPTPAWPAQAVEAAIAANAANAASAAVSSSPPTTFAPSTPAAQAAAALDVSGQLELAAGLTTYAADKLIRSDDGSNAMYEAQHDGVIVRAQQDASEPLIVGGASVHVSSRGGEAVTGAVVAVLVTSTTSTSASQAAEAGGNHAGATIASPLVVVTVVGDGSGAASGDATTAGANVSDADAASVLVSVSIPVDEPAHGQGSCLPSWLFDVETTPNATCVAGCCVDGVCVCRLGYTGALCDQELRCALVPEGGSGFDDGSACATHPTSAGMLTCSCEALGSVAVLSFRHLPATNSLSWHQMRELTPLLFDLTGTESPWPIVSLFLPSLMLLAVGCAACADRRTRYLSMASPRLPWCVRLLLIALLLPLLSSVVF